MITKWFYSYADRQISILKSEEVMHRDMDLIRKILMKVADNPSGWAPDDLSLEG